MPVNRCDTGLQQLYKSSEVQEFVGSQSGSSHERAIFNMEHFVRFISNSFLLYITSKNSPKVGHRNLAVLF